MKDAVTAGLVMGMSIAFVVSLALVAFYGQVLWVEQRQWILITEIVFLSCIFIYGVYLFYKAVWMGRRVR